MDKKNYAYYEAKFPAPGSWACLNHVKSICVSSLLSLNEKLFLLLIRNRFF